VGEGVPGVPQLYGEFWSLLDGKSTGPKEMATLIPLATQVSRRERERGKEII
jgi:hypothetical protein